MRKKMSTIVLFGGSGFVGSHLINLLNDKFDTIYVADIREPGWHSPDIIKNKTRLSYVPCDVRKSIPENLFGTSVECIVNLAAVHTSPGHPSHEYFDANINGAQNICQYADKTGVKKIIFTSSISIYGPGEDEKSEVSIPMPSIPYGSSKIIAEYIHREWFNNDKEKKLLTIIRPAVIFGHGEGGNFTRIANMLEKGFFPYPGRTDTVKGCLYVKDICRFIIQQIESGKGYSFYNFCYQKKYTTKDIVKAFSKAVGYRAFCPLIPLGFVNLGAKCLSLFQFQFIKNMGLVPDRIVKLVKSTNISSEKLARSGFTFNWTLEEALADWSKDCGGKHLY
jgi:nucleoside-diphosphate-sugar epimerase